MIIYIKNFAALLLLFTAAIMLFPIPTSIITTLWSLATLILLFYWLRLNQIVRLLPFIIIPVLALTFKIPIPESLPLLTRAALIIGLWSLILTLSSWLFWAWNPN